MKSDVFYWILNMSIHGGLMCLIVLLLRRIKALPRGFVYGLWILPLLRLAIPFGINSPLSIMRLLEKLGTRRVAVPRTEGSFLLYSMNSLQLADRYSPIVYESNVLTKTMETLALIWIIVACVCVLVVALLYALSCRSLGKAEKKAGYYFSDRITAPVLCGIFRPKILLPYSISESALPYVLCHEGIHAHRGDNFWRLLGILLCCLHWFNPLCWLSLKYFFEDMELSCDALAVCRMDEAERKNYALALVETAEQKSLFASAFGGAKLRPRVENILAYRNLTLGASLAFAALFAVIALVLATN